MLLFINLGVVAAVFAVAAFVTVAAPVAVVIGFSLALDFAMIAGRCRCRSCPYW